jgi:1-aminocyclopropane-1-carboxylate deaminase
MNDVYALNTSTEKHYDAIVCAVGTGTMISGLINGSKYNEVIIGIPVLKNEASIRSEIELLLDTPYKPFTLLPDFHGGGYAKTSEAQIQFMNQFWEKEKIPTDIVYTGKLFWAVDQLIKNSYFTNRKRLLIIHSGGLQGNRSLSNGILDF